jgi:S-adenosylmethionine:tRNA ribosyltransferase-isomerase
MKTDELNYDLPEALIAQHPPIKRSDSRLLVLDRKQGSLRDEAFKDICRLIRPGDCLVLNDTKVLPARFFARRQTGGQLEGLFLQTSDRTTWRVLLKGSRKVKFDEVFHLVSRDKQSIIPAKIMERHAEGQCTLEVDSDDTAESILNQIGFPPLPPYIRRDDNATIADEDRQRYQTVFAKQNGAIAAPTAGLHFTRALLEQLTQSGVHLAKLTLHVGTGTFKPVTTEDIEDHPIHSERVIVGPEAIKRINQTRDQGGRIIAVGTTSVRSLESAAVGAGKQARLAPYNGPTKLFITPGYQFKLVDCLITNFHLPKSTLLALVSAMAGIDTIRAAYAHAIFEKYRFFSYGDAMMIV